MRSREETVEEHDRRPQGLWWWLGEELAHEARQARASDGILPPRPDCLSEVEAVGLLLLIRDAQQCELASGMAAGAALRLVHTLQDHLQNFGTNNGAGGMG